MTDLSSRGGRRMSVTQFAKKSCEIPRNGKLATRNKRAEDVCELAEGLDAQKIALNWLLKGRFISFSSVDRVLNEKSLILDRFFWKRFILGEYVPRHDDKQAYQGVARGDKSCQHSGSRAREWLTSKSVKQTNRNLLCVQSYTFLCWRAVEVVPMLSGALKPIH